MPAAKCPPGQTRDKVTKECRDKKKPGRQPKPVANVVEKYTQEDLEKKTYDFILKLHKSMEDAGKIMMRKGMKRDRAHLIDRILRKQ
jgi:hypothetical protein